jgi:carboxypeptidase C (cathepsin A)
MKLFLVFLLLLVLFFSDVSSVYTNEALNDQVVALPGSPDVTFKHFAGYVGVGGNKQMFYNFVEAVDEPEKKPVILWTNGGPGCSGLLGLFTENGPFRPSKEGQLTMNTYSWNEFANIVFIEQPVGVGFSYTGGDNIKYGDQQAAYDNYQFILGFFKKFPNYASNDFYITSESYGGHYIPTLATNIVKLGGVDNFKGLAVGNPITWMPYRNYGQVATFAGHQTVPKPMWDRFLELQCDTVVTPDYSGECAKIYDAILDLNADFDPYSLDFPVCQNEQTSSGRYERYIFLRHILSAQSFASSKSIKKSDYLRILSQNEHSFLGDSSYFPEDYQPCVQDYTEDYLNRADVQQAMHINSEALGNSFHWSQCNGNIDYNLEDVNAPMQPYWEFLTSCGAELNMMIYSGDDDSICATAGTQRFLWEMNWDVEKEWTAWKTEDNQIGGFKVLFNNPRDENQNGKLHFTTVHGAGHMVPSTRPSQAMELIKKWINNEL